MDMESNGEFSDHSVVVKRKRTKRQRPSSSFCAATVTSSSSSGGAFGGGGGGGSFNYFSIQSPSVSTDVSLTTEEEEDMANCLIMLARSDYPTELVKADHQNTDKLSSRRFTEIVNATTAVGKTGHCVYECKTCNRTFPSFQALGGHRASHKKPKSSVPEEIEKKALSPPLIKNEEETKINKSIDSLPPLSLQILGNSKAKVHECSICGAEFASGQALGGHMRRHRTTTTVTTPYSPPLMSSQIITNMDATDIVENRRSNMLLLDLNLPAPEDDHLDSKFQFASTSQHLVFSAPALVNCHY